MALKKKYSCTPMGVIIKKRLIDLDMTQKELADKIGIRKNFLHMMIYGYRPGNKYIPKIEQVLGIDLEIFKKSA